MHGHHGCSPHHAAHHGAGHHVHGVHNIHGAHNMHAAHHINHMHTHPGPFQSGPFRSGPFQGGPFHRRGYGPTVYVGQGYGNGRPLMKFSLCIGIVLLTVAVVLIFCGILNFAGVIKGETFSVGVPLLGFGGVMFLAGLLFTALSCCVMKRMAAYEEQNTGENVCPPPGQMANNSEYVQSSGQAEFNQSPGKVEFSQPPSNAEYGQPPGNAPPNWYPPSAPLPGFAPPPYAVAAAVYPGPASESSSTVTPYPQIGFVVPSVANP